MNFHRIVLFHFISLVLSVNLFAQETQIPFKVDSLFDFDTPKTLSLSFSEGLETFNGYFNTNDYYNNSRILAIVNIKSGKVVDVIGRRPPLFLKYKNLPNFDHFAFDINQDEAMINFWCDSTIYIIDKQSKLALGKFGIAGNEMKTDYYATKDYPEAHERWNKDVTTYGYYQYLKYLTQLKLILRGYQKSGENQFDGLQFYSNYRLIGDINVPKGLKIFGNVGNSMIGFNTDEESPFEIYKITLNYEK